MDPHQKEIYKFLGVEQADGVKTKEIYNRVKEEINRRLQMLTELNYQGDSSCGIPNECL